MKQELYQDKISPISIQYIETALWSSVDDDGNDLDSLYSMHDLSTEAMNRVETDLMHFQNKAGSLLDGLDLETVAHDFWLTRNGHGAGFWDGDYQKTTGEALTALAHSFGEVDLYLGDDGKLYFS